jgi:hypothetical protein
MKPTTTIYRIVSDELRAIRQPDAVADADAVSQNVRIVSKSYFERYVLKTYSDFIIC